MANISRISIPTSTGQSATYDLKDASALHDATAFAPANTLSLAKQYTNEKVASVIHFRGSKTNVNQITSLTSAIKGDIWLSTSDNKEWICKEGFSGGAKPDNWEMLGKTYNAASTTHQHTVTISPSNRTTIYSMNTVGSVKAGTPSSYTGHSFSPNKPTKINLNTFDPGEMPKFTRGSQANWSASVTANDDGADTQTLSFSWTPNTVSSCSSGRIPNIPSSFYVAGTQATHNAGTFTPNVPTSVTLPTRTAVNNVWIGSDKSTTTGGPQG